MMVFWYRHLPSLMTEEFIDAAYQYGAGIDMCWDRLWDYRSIHAQSVIRWGRQALYHNFGKERFHDATLDQADSQLLIALWVIAQLPLTVQFELRILRQMYDRGVTTGDPAVVSFRMAEGAVYKAIPKVSD